MVAIIKSISLAAIVICIGCAPTFNWQGQWRGERNLPTPPGGDPSVGKTLGRVDLEIDAGGTFTLIEAGIPKTGKIRTSGMTATLTVEHIAGRPIARLGEGIVKANLPIKLEATREGTILFVDPGGFFAEAVTLQRQAKP